MAFGKNPNTLSNVAAFGGRSNLRNQGRMSNSRPERRGSAPYYLNQFKPVAEPGANPDIVRLIKGEYKVQVPVKNPATGQFELQENTFFYYPCVEHIFMAGPNQPRGYICSGGPWKEWRDKREPCHGCENFFAAKANKNKSSPHGRSDLSVFTVLHFAHYAKVPQVDKDGNYRMNENTQQPYYEWVRVFPHEVKKYEQQGAEMRDWALLHWPLKFGAFNTVTEYDLQVGKCCVSCQSRFSINTVAWLCEGCGIDLIDPSSQSFQGVDIDKMINEPTRCSHCGHVGMLQEIIECNACQHARRAEIFDVDLMVKRVQNPKTEKLELMMMGFEGPRPLDPRFTTPDEDGRKPIAHAIDLARVYAPTPIEKQEDILGGSKTGRAPVTNQQFSRPWGGNQGHGQPAGGGSQGPNYGG